MEKDGIAQVSADEQRDGGEGYDDESEAGEIATDDPRSPEREQHDRRLRLEQPAWIARQVRCHVRPGKQNPGVAVARRERSTVARYVEREHHEHTRRQARREPQKRGHSLFPAL